MLFWTTFGIAVFEALVCNCSVIVGDDSGCWEWIQKAQAGISVPHGSPKKLEDAIRWSLNDENQDTIQKQKTKGIHFIKEHFLYSSLAMKYIEEYQKLCKRYV